MKPIALLAILSLSTTTPAGQKPNIVLIKVDDMGFSDLPAYGGEIDTRHLDSVAKNGLRFNQFYHSARCCPTCATLMTGLHPHEVGIGHMTGKNSENTPERPPA